MKPTPKPRPARMTYKLSRKAFNDLKEIYKFGFSNFGERQAREYTAELKQSLTVLAQTPLICRERTEYSPRVRIYHHESHQIIYKIQPDQIFIIRILHKSVDTPRHLPPT